MFASLPRDVPREDLVRGLAAKDDWRQRLYLDMTEEEIAEKRLSDARTAGVHQVLVGMRFGLKIIREELGIRFVLIPPGTAYGTVNPTPYYLAETLVSEADWARIMGEYSPAASNPGFAKVNISVSDVLRFLERANEQLGYNARFDIPSSKQWRFAVAVGGTSALTGLKSPQLKTGQPSALGLYDLLGVVWQLCQRSNRYDLGDPRRYEWRGGSYKPSLNNSSQDTPTMCTYTGFRSPEFGFRPVLVVSS
jgi:formylglycine-generating enzyme required for sulfatase activity